MESVGRWRASGGRPSVTRHGRHRTSPALHVTRKTRSRRLAVAPLHHGASRCTMEHHDATGVTTPRQTVKASPHRHKWMLSHGAPADPSDPWNSHAAPVSPRQNGQQAEEGQQRYTSRTTPHVTCVTRHAQNAKPTSRCRTVAPWSTMIRRVLHPETNGE